MKNCTGPNIMGSLSYFDFDLGIIGFYDSLTYVKKIPMIFGPTYRKRLNFYFIEENINVFLLFPNFTGQDEFQLSSANISHYSWCLETDHG